MQTNWHLIAHNVISVASTIATLGLAFFTYLNGPRKRINIIAALVLVSTTVFIVSHVIGVNISDPDLSKNVLMWNLSMIFVGAFNLHLIFIFIGKEREKVFIIILSYATAIIMTVFFIIFSDYFLLPSVSKMYFVNYYNPGSLNFLRVVFLYIIIIPFMLYEMYISSKNMKSELEHKQHTYFSATLIIAYLFGFIPNFLVYNIPVDPLWGMLFSVLFLIPFAYGGIQYQLFNIKVIAKQAFIYSVCIFVVGGMITLFNYSNTWIISSIPNFPIWITPIISAILSVSIGFLVWRNLRQNDILKYEFITTVTHKFRTPLTYVKWSAENLLNPNLSATEKNEQVKYIKSANEKLIELTNILVNASDVESKNYEYQIEKNDLSSAVFDISKTLEIQFMDKKLKIERDIEGGIFVPCDISRIKFVTQVFIENAIHYSYEGGLIKISLKKWEREVVCSVLDQGIGMSKDKIALLFSKFYRSNEARKADTEGMGIGLFISREIINRHKGRIWAISEGEGKGSIFTFSLPL